MEWRPAKDRFWEKVDVRGPDECWPWVAGRSGDYGIFNAGNRRIVRASIFSLELKLGRRLRKRRCACHSCDNPPCCNPFHLFEGTRRDNALDAGMKGRLHVVIPDDVVRSARTLRQNGATLEQISEQLGVSTASVSRFARRIDNGGRRFVDGQGGLDT